MVITTLTEIIGATPVFKFTNNDYPMPEDSVIYAKLEYLNPGGSIKDRLGDYLIKRGLQNGTINSGTTIIEPTAGNTGIGLALAALSFHLPTIFVVPEQFSSYLLAVPLSRFSQIHQIAIYQRESILSRDHILKKF